MIGLMAIGFLLLMFAASFMALMGAYDAFKNRDFGWAFFFILMLTGGWCIILGAAAPYDPPSFNQITD